MVSGNQNSLAFDLVKREEQLVDENNYEPELHLLINKAIENKRSFAHENTISVAGRIIVSF